jgi:hexosaminidase
MHLSARRYAAYLFNRFVFPGFSGYLTIILYHQNSIMKKTFSVVCLCLLLCTILSAQQRVNIVPAPVSVHTSPGNFVLNRNTVLTLSSPNAQLQETARWFVQQLAAVTGWQLQVKNKPMAGTPAIRLQLNESPDAVIGTEGYLLDVTTQGITLKANQPAGIFYGLQTIWQLLPPAAETAGRVSNTGWTVPCVNITDYPRFGWRGLMLDVSRHFFTKAEVKRYIDEMVKYKYNTFHWHLSDDNGWRIEIKSLPRLTAVGAWRVPRTGRWGTFPAPEPGEQATDGGFYTQDDIREILAYAKARYVTVLPEIDVPAHSLALIAAYPGLSCTQQPYPVNPGSHFYKRLDNALCIGNDSTFLVLDKVFTEIAALFPSPYIHVGGDEAYKGFWDQCPRCRQRMQAEQLKDVNELQSYFVKRMEKILQSKGKKLIGWDEILEGGLAPDATVMSWRGMKGGIEAARMNHHVVMTPWGNCYLDLYQGDPMVEPETYGMLHLKTSYAFEPVPDSVDAKFILGGQGNLWTESVPSFRHAEYMTWPRALALAEVLWSPKEHRNWDDFVARMEVQMQRFDAAGINYSRAAYDPWITATRKDSSSPLQVKLGCEISNTQLYYTFDNTNPDQFAHLYKGELLEFPKGATTIKVITYKNGKPLGKQVNVPVTVLEKRAKERPDF